jgi:hypothetical protein
MCHTQSAPVTCNLVFLLLGYGGGDLFTTDLRFSKNKEHFITNTPFQTPVARLAISLL